MIPHRTNFSDILFPWPDFGSERPDFGSQRSDLKSEEGDLKTGKANSRLDYEGRDYDRKQKKNCCVES